MPNQCICGNSTGQFQTFSVHLTQPDGHYSVQECSRFLECSQCGLIRYLGPPQEYSQYPPTKKPYSVKDYEHDRSVAVHRCDHYGLYGAGDSDVSVLDIGSGSGAFVDECRTRGYRAFGCELIQYHYQRDDRFIYRREFISIGFPTDHFSIVTIHDVLEHVPDPLQFLKEAFRILQQGGDFILDFPRFFHESGDHHWKPEHLWYFTEEQLSELLASAGFSLSAVSHPIPSKVVFVCSKPSQERPTILVPPGIGDSYWSIVKMEAFLEKYKLGLPDVSVVCPRSKRHNGHQRAFPFLEMFPFINCTWNALDSQDQKSKEIWREAYSQVGRTVFKNVLGNDYFLSYNGHLRVGRQLEEADDLSCNWHPKMFVSLEQDNFQRYCQERFGRYIVFYFVFQGTYNYWTAEFPVASVIESVKRICALADAKPVFAGSRWDAEEPNSIRVRNSINGGIDLVGKTSVQQLFGLLHGAELVVGYPSGLTIMSAVLGIKTLCIWNTYYNPDFFNYAMPPDTRERNYFINVTKGLTPVSLAEQARRILNQEDVPPISKERIQQIPISKGEKKEKKISRSRSKSSPKLLSKAVRPLSIACVLKSGGDYGIEHVIKLRNMLIRHCPKFKFYVLTDFPDPGELGDCQVISLKDNLPGWWSKIELFRPNLFETERALYFDLDTVIVGDCLPLFSLDQPFYGLRPWNPKNRASGVMASGMMGWETKKFHFIYNDFKSIIMGKYPGDQNYITEALRCANIFWTPFQTILSGIHSFKRECRAGLPTDSRIICFHGLPRPTEVKAAWVLEHYR